MARVPCETARVMGAVALLCAASWPHPGGASHHSGVAGFAACGFALGFPFGASAPRHDALVKDPPRSSLKPNSRRPSRGFKSSCLVAKSV